MLTFFKHTLLPALLAILLVAGAGLGVWQWGLSQPVSSVEVLGTTHAAPDSLRALARLDTTLTLRDASPRIMEGRLARHPWVHRATVTRWPTGAVVARITERTPVALMLDDRGRPAFYLDAHGFQMPPVKGHTYDVPLLRGFTGPQHPTRPAEDAVLRAILHTLATAPPAIDALLADLEQRAGGDVWLHTAPIGTHGSLAVRLGQEAFTARLHRLHAFVEQAVRTQPDQEFASVDLRFAEQIVARQAPRDP